MVEWLSDNRAGFAAVIVLLLVAMFIWSIALGRKLAVLTAKDEVFGDPQRTRGGWYWALKKTRRTWLRCWTLGVCTN